MHRTHFEQAPAAADHRLRQIAPHVATALAADLVADDAVAAVGFGDPGHAGDTLQRRRRRRAPLASTWTYIVSEPRSRAVRLCGVSSATTRPLLMMTTRSQVCDTSGRMWVLRMIV